MNKPDSLWNDDRGPKSDDSSGIIRDLSAIAFFVFANAVFLLLMQRYCGWKPALFYMFLVGFPLSFVFIRVAFYKKLITRQGEIDND